MKMVRILMDGKEVASRVSVADYFFARLKGLIRKMELEEDEGLLICPCNQIHTIGMKFTIDAVFLSKSGEILHLESDFAPGLVSKHIFGAHQVLELPAGSIQSRGMTQGKILALDPL
jgi:uncharacterized protein